MSYTVYKVVRKLDDGRFISAAVEELEAQLEYRLGKVTKGLPNSLGVFVFKSLEAALEWEFISYPIVLECESSEPVQVPVRIASYRSLIELGVFKIFAGRKTSFKRRLKWTAKFSLVFSLFHEIPGSGVVPAVTPIRVVYRDGRRVG